MTRNNKQIKERGFWASFWIIFFALQSIFYVFLIYDFLYRADTIDKPILLAGLILVTIADLIGLTAIWFWKKWGWYIFAASTVVSIVLGMIATGTQLIVFHDILPLAVLGWVFREKWDGFK